MADDLTVCVRDDLTLEVRGQLIDQLLLVKLLQVLQVIVLEKSADVTFDFARQVGITFDKVLHRADLLLQDGGFDIDIGDDTG